jgi:hypothetical protein
MSPPHGRNVDVGLGSRCDALHRTRPGISQAAADNRRTHALLAQYVVVVSGEVKPSNSAVHDPKDGLAIGAASSQLKSTNQWQGDLHSADVLVLLLVGKELGPIIQPFRAIRDSGAGL